MILKAGAAGLALILFIPVLIAAGISGAISTVFDGSAGSVDCTLAGDASTAVAGYGPEQLASAATIVAVGKQRNVPAEGWVVAIAAAMQESGLRNLDHGDRDSLGLFQQRPSQGWGTPVQIMNPTYAATQFYQHLLAVPGWQHMSVNDAAQAVQHSAFPDAYAHHEQAARQIVAAVGSGNSRAIPENHEQFVSTCTQVSGSAGRRARLAALAALAAELPAAVLATLLDLNIHTANALATYAQHDWITYLRRAGAS